MNVYEREDRGRVKLSQLLKACKAVIEASRPLTIISPELDQSIFDLRFMVGEVTDFHDMVPIEEWD